MRERIEHLLDVDTASRWRIVLITALAVALSGFAIDHSGAPSHRDDLAAIIFGSLVFCMQIGLYAKPIRRLSLQGTGSISRASLFRSPLKFAASAVIIVAASLSGPIMQAAILNRRLKDAVRRINDPKTSTRTTLALGNTAIASANALKIPLDKESLAAFGLGASKIASNEPELKDVARESLQLSLDQRSLQPDVQSLLLAQEWIEIPKQYFPAIGIKEFQGISIYMSKRTVPIQSCALGETIGTPSYFETIGLKKCPEFFRFVGDLVHIAPPLDGYHLRNTIFQSVRVPYNGGRVILENVAFVDCIFSFSGADRNTSLFADAILKNREVNFKVLE